MAERKQALVGRRRLRERLALAFFEGRAQAIDAARQEIFLVQLHMSSGRMGDRKWEAGVDPIDKCEAQQYDNKDKPMTRKTFARIIVAAAIAAMPGGASLIIAANTAAGLGAETAPGFFH